jgi:hypothetical protein
VSGGAVTRSDSHRTRGDANRLRFAVDLAYLRYPGVMLGSDARAVSALLRRVASQLKVSTDKL